MRLRFLAFVFGFLSFGWLNVNRAPAPMPIVRSIVTPWTKRPHAKLLGAAASLRDMLKNLAASFFAPLACNAGVLNYFLDPLPVFPYQQAPQKENMPRSVHIRDLVVNISGTLDVSGGTGDGTLNTEAIARLIRRITVRWDGFDLVQPMEARDLAALGRRLTGQPLSGTPVTIPGIQTTNFELKFFIPFARSYNADPFDTALPPLQVRKEFVVEIEWETARSNAVVGTSLGSGAIITGGDRVVALTNVQATVLPRQARNAARPWYIPQISAYETVQFNAANPRLVLDMEQNEAFDAVLFRTLEDSLRDPANLINTLTFETKNVKVLEDVPFTDLRAIEEDMFPGVVDASEVGNLFLRFADGGKLGNAVNPAQLTLPKFEFDVATPNNNPGVIRAITMELLSIPGVTVR